MMLLHRKLTHSLIGCACEVIHELGSGFLGIVVQEKVMVELKGVNTMCPGASRPSTNNPVYPVHRCSSKIYPCSTPRPDVRHAVDLLLKGWGDRGVGVMLEELVQVELGLVRILVEKMYLHQKPE